MLGTLYPLPAKLTVGRIIILIVWLKSLRCKASEKPGVTYFGRITSVNLAGNIYGGSSMDGRLYQLLARPNRRFRFRLKELLIELERE